MRSVSRVIFTVACVVQVFAGSAVAQQTRLDPSDPAASVATTPTISAFADYRPFREQNIAPWKQVLDEVAGVPGAAGHVGHKATEPKETMSAPSAADDKRAMSRAEPQPSTPTEMPTSAAGGTIMATGVVKSIDKANSKVKLIHDPIAALGWPRMTMFFRLKNAALAEQIKEGDTVQFSLEKTASGYVITGFKKTEPDKIMRAIGKGEK